MAETALSVLLEELKAVEKWNPDLLHGSENEWQLLNKELNDMRSSLSAADDRSKKEEAFQKEGGKIREVVYDVEEAIGNCLTAKAKSSIRRHLSLSKTKISLAKEVRSLTEEKVKPVLENLTALSVGGGAIRSEQPPSRPKKDQSIWRQEVVGFEDEEAKLVSYLTEPGKQLDVISIIGMPGLGKTTLAWKIFESEQICYEFPVRIWVHVSQRFNHRDVFCDILRKFTSNDMSGLDDKELEQSVRAYLAREKFLLVMDDVWSSEDWEVIQKVLPERNGLSKVLITSRHLDVGKHANTSRAPHELRLLRNEESWKLLKLVVFGDVEHCPPELEDIGIQIVSQCSGVPLTVVVVGGILVDLLDKTPHSLEEEWQRLSENVSGLIQDDKGKLITNAVELSYNGLADYLRECFLYTAVFPEDYAISAWTLMRLWIAEGFIRPEEGKTLEETAKENLVDLIRRNLVMADKINPMGEIKTCRVQPMIHAFCRSKALEQNLFQEIRENKEGVLEPSVSEMQKFLRLCLHSGLTKFFSAKPNGPRIRSFLCFYKELLNIPDIYTSTIPDAFVLLRVLESISIKFHQFPAKVTKLIHLRYVTLHIDDLNMLEETLSRLWNLQTIVVETKSRSITMKANIWKMYRLRHVKMNAAIVLDEGWNGEGGENLQTLSRLAPVSCTEKVWQRACNLKELGIRGELATLSSTMSMEKLGRLEKLKLMNDPLPADTQHGGGLSLLQPKFFPPNLKRLTLSSTFLDWKHMQTLSKITTLEVLKLKDNAFVGIYWSAAEDDCFPNLFFLLIANADLVQWEVSNSSFPNLKCLVLKNCENLNHIPEVLGETLEKLHIRYLRKSAVDSARSLASKKSAPELGKVDSKVPFQLVLGPECI